MLKAGARFYSALLFTSHRLPHIRVGHAYYALTRRLSAVLYDRRVNRSPLFGLPLSEAKRVKDTLIEKSYSVEKNTFL